MVKKLAPQKKLRIRLSTSNKINQRICNYIEETLTKFVRDNVKITPSSINELSMKSDTKKIMEIDTSTMIFTAGRFGLAFGNGWFLLPDTKSAIDANGKTILS